MTKIIVRLEGHYEVKEALFSRSYEWHPAYVTIKCDCGEELTLSSTTSSAASSCQCGTDHSAIIQDIQAREGRLRGEVTYPWQYDAKEQAQQHLHDEAAYPESSPWRYNDVTSPNNHV
ncbi:MAG: hypothetical protein JOZ19_05140 [Rubrobacter sp.]|nr:hypothetical protein [Rubrobacter sp.]